MCKVNNLNSVHYTNSLLFLGRFAKIRLYSTLNPSAEHVDFVNTLKTIFVNVYKIIVRFFWGIGGMEFHYINL